VTTPADELRAAAEKLRALAAAATPLPWRKHDAAYPHLVIQAPVDVPASECTGMISTNLTPNEDGDAAYIAAMHPGVGAALADWLDRMADATEAVNDWTLGAVATLNLEALAVARAINAA